ncbi:MAG: hypothetical protein C7B45_10120 [Sulfobacillus acidophilus]|uniref:Uncharacterized protein n=1 Tax=Sulfobacillus acidophilus TaxID=53633 RepID=A0A2T2WHE9_9FIRM|nr:MAG: hypothetical protein C7B45_10120 [Sulfobacillus acidophilus]
MDRLMQRFKAAIVTQFGDAAWTEFPRTIPTELQGFAGVLRGAFAAEPTLVTVRLTVLPWDMEERWAMMVRGRELGPMRFWEWLADAPACRVPFITKTFTSQCSACQDVPCLHGAALTYHWLVHAREMPQFLLLLLNRRGRNRHGNATMQPIARVPVSLGTNLERTRQELVAIVEAAMKAAAEERDNLFGGDASANSGERH